MFSIASCFFRDSSLGGDSHSTLDRFGGDGSLATPEVPGVPMSNTGSSSRGRLVWPLLVEAIGCDCSDGVVVGSGLGATARETFRLCTGGCLAFVALVLGDFVEAGGDDAVAVGVGVLTGAGVDTCIGAGDGVLTAPLPFCLLIGGGWSETGGGRRPALKFCCCWDCWGDGPEMEGCWEIEGRSWNVERQITRTLR